MKRKGQNLLPKKRCAMPRSSSSIASFQFVPTTLPAPYFDKGCIFLIFCFDNAIHAQKEVRSAAVIKFWRSYYYEILTWKYRPTCCCWYSFWNSCVATELSLIDSWGSSILMQPNDLNDESICVMCFGWKVSNTHTPEVAPSCDKDATTRDCQHCVIPVQRILSTWSVRM